MTKELFGGPDAPNEAQTPNDIRDVGPDEFADGFAADPRSADFDELDPVFQNQIEDKVERYNERFEDASDRNDRGVTINAKEGYTRYHISAEEL